MVSVTPKHIAREVDMDFRYVRMLLRGRQKHKPYVRWKFTEDEAREIIEWLKSRKNKNEG
jgi:hypothetical protein